MNIYETREKLKTKSINDLNLRVTFYARVSSEKDEQLNSLDNQVAYFENYIKSNPNWTYIPGYVDEGISGISTQKRDRFLKMISDSQIGLFDIIITKEISRFARNTVDSLQYTRSLLSNGVGVIFQNDNINTVDGDGELRLSIMSSIAQDELRKLSDRVRFGHQQAIKSGVVLGNSNIFGYRKENKRLVIDEEQAALVRELFELYSTGEYSFRSIENIFWDKGYRNTRGNRIMHSTLSGIITNPKYKGYYVGNKVRIVDMFSKKQEFVSEEDWVMYKDETGNIVPSIVSEELWEKANEVFRKRSEDVKGRQGICNRNNTYTGKIICGDCGVSYYRHDTSKNAKDFRWVCSDKIKNKSKSCKSFAIYESELDRIIIDLFRNLTPNIDKIIERYISVYKEQSDSNDFTQEIANQKNLIRREQKKKGKLLDFVLDGRITDDQYLDRSKDCDNAILKAEETIKTLLPNSDSEESFNRQIAEMRTIMHSACSDAKLGEISKSFIDKFIDKIIVTPVSESESELEIYLKTGENEKTKIFRKKAKELKSKKICSEIEQIKDGSTGHMSKKMIESYERNMK